MARRRFFVDEVRGGYAKVEGDDAHHLTRVLRVEAGQKYEISDNRNVYLAEIEEARKNLVSFAVIERLAPQAFPAHITLYASLIRFERFETLLEKATELGTRHIVPVQAERSENGLDRAALKRMSRWLRVVREASEQSRRTTMPEIAEPVRLDTAVHAAAGLKLLLDEDRAALPILAALPHARHDEDEIAVLVGPEGGWSDRERAAILEAGWIAVSLGPQILKTETAAMAALAVLNAAWQAKP